MIGYTEVIQVMAAMVIFSLILLSANHMIHRNTALQIEGELEQEVISLAQEIIDEARTKSFDEITVGAAAPPAAIPGGFTDANNLGPDAGENNRTAFNDFDDYNGWSGAVETVHGTFTIRSEVFYVDPVNFDSTGNKSTFKKIQVFVTSNFLTKSDGVPTEYRLEFIRNYYAD